MNSSYFSEFNTPWALENANNRYDWYVIVVDNIPEKVESTLNYVVIETLDYSFCNNEWRFRQFILFYKQYLDLIEWHTEVIHQLKYDELRVIDKTGLQYPINGNRFIIQEEIPFINFRVYTHDELLERLHEASMEYDTFEEEAIPFIMAGKELFSTMKKYFMDTPEMRCIQKLTVRLSMLYLFIYYCIINSDYGGDWFTNLSDADKERIEKIANFDKVSSVDSLDYNDIYNEYYVFYAFLIQACNYNGRLVEDYVEGEVVKE